MGKTAFVFPGQGAQYIGMGKDFYEKEAVSREVFEKASRVTGLDLPAICFEENEKLDITEYTQIAMLTVELAVLEALKERGFAPDVTAGLSLGEYGAVAAAGAMEMEEAFAIVRRRGIYMQEAVPEGGAMAAVLGMENSLIEEVCSRTEGIVTVANYNCPGQLVISGEADAVERAGQVLKEKGAKRDAAVINAAAALFVADKAPGLKEAVRLAEETIDSGRAFAQLEKFIRYSNLEQT